MSSLGLTILSARETIFHFFRSLPIAMFVTLITLGSFQGNINLILFAIGLGITAPLLATCSNIIFEFLFSALDNKFELDHSYWSIPNGASCTLFDTLSKNPLNSMNSVPTTWCVMTAFFFSYLFLNAYDIYTREIPNNADEIAVDARKTRCGMAMFFIIVLGLVSLFARYSVTHCETGIGLIIGSGIGIYSSYLWYQMVRACGTGIFDDIFGISSRMLSPNANMATAQACVIAPTTS